MGHDKTAKANNISQRRRMPNVMSSACTPGLNCLETSKETNETWRRSAACTRGICREKHLVGILAANFCKQTYNPSMELCKTRVPTDTWRRSAACKGAPAEKNIQLNSSAAHCYAWAVVIVVALLMTTASDHRGSV